MAHNERMSNHDERPNGPAGTPDAENPQTDEPTTRNTSPGELEPAEATRRSEPEAPATLTHTRTAGTWAAVVVATVALIVLLVFILQNLQPTTVTFLGLKGNLPVGVALLLAAAIGGLSVAFVGAARILQLRRTAQKKRS